MNTDTTPAAPGGEPLRAEVISTGRAPQMPEGIPEADHSYADRILAMDTIRDVPSPVKGPAGKRYPKMTVETLAPEMRGEIYQKLQGVPEDQRAEAEHRLVAEHIEGQLPSIRLKTGVGEGALPYHKELMTIAQEYDALAKEHQRYADMLDDVSRFETLYDPETGEPIVGEVMKVRGSRRTHYERHMADLQRRMRLLANADGTPGLEGQKRAQGALKESIAILRQREQEAEDLARVNARAEEINREASIEKRAQARARMKRGGADL